MEPPGVGHRAVSLMNSFHVRLRLTGEKNAHRLILRRNARSVELILDDLSDVRDVVCKLLENWSQRRRDDELRNWQPVRGVDLRFDLLIGGERTFVPLRSEEHTSE